MAAALEETGRLRPDEHGTLVLPNKRRTPVIFCRSEALVALLSMERLEFLARFQGHRLPGKMPEFLVFEQFQGFDGLGKLGRKLIRHGCRGRDRVQQLGLKAAVTPLRALPEALIESL